VHAENLYQRFITLLGVPIKPPSHSYLSELVRAHLSVIPFENISKIYYKTHLGLTEIPPLELYLEGVEKHHFGGTCYSNNYYFFKLLENLGYEVILCAADMKNPGSHAVRPGARRIEDFSEVITNSFRPDSTFLNTVLLTKYKSGCFCVLHNLEFIESTPGRSAVHQLSDLDAMVQRIENTFKIKQSITQDIITGIELTSDAWD